jgi:hypothetical protein
MQGKEPLVLLRGYPDYHFRAVCAQVDHPIPPLHDCPHPSRIFQYFLVMNQNYLVLITTIPRNKLIGI